MSIESLMEHPLTIKRVVAVSNGKGGFTNSLQAIATIQGRAWPMKQSDWNQAGRHEARLTHAIIFPPGTDIRVEDWVEYGGVDYEVHIGPYTPSKPIYTKVFAERLQPNV